MATALLQQPPAPQPGWSTPSGPSRRVAATRALGSRPGTGLLTPHDQTVPLAQAVPQTIGPDPAPPRFSRTTRTMTTLCLVLGACTVGLYLHTLRLEGDAHQQQQEIRKLKEGNHFLQVRLAQVTNLGRVETAATEQLNMVAKEDGVYLALPDEVANLANTRIIPGREPTPAPVMPGF